jgi:hypothetical protein
MYKTSSSVNAFVSALYNLFDSIFTAIIDTLWEIAVLITRTVATCFYGVGLGINAVDGYFTTPESANKQLNIESSSPSGEAPSLSPMDDDKHNIASPQ